MNTQSTYPHLNNIRSINKSLIKLLLPLTPLNVYKTVVQEAVKVVNAFGGTIFLYDEEAKQFIRKYTTVTKQQQFFPRPNGATYWVYTHNKPKIVSATSLRKHHPEAGSVIHSVLLLPLVVGEKPIGVLSIKFSDDKPFTVKHLETLKLFSNIASLAIRNAHLNAQNQKDLEVRELFLTIASHEIKTPLTAVKAYTQLMQKNRKLSPADKKSLHAILRNVDTIIDIMSSLFLVSEMSSGLFMIQKKDLNLYTLIDQIKQDLEISSGRTISFHSYQQTVPYQADELHLSSVIINVLRNAILYAGERAKISIYLTKSIKYVIIRIQDTGSGIDPNDLLHITEKYYRPKHHVRGLGIGLFVSAAIIKAHKGVLTIKSPPGKGTIVTIKLPRT